MSSNETLAEQITRIRPGDEVTARFRDEDTGEFIVTGSVFADFGHLYVGHSLLVNPGGYVDGELVEIVSHIPADPALDAIEAAGVSREVAERVKASLTEAGYALGSDKEREDVPASPAHDGERKLVMTDTNGNKYIFLEDLPDGGEVGCPALDTAAVAAIVRAFDVTDELREYMRGGERA